MAEITQEQAEAAASEILGESLFKRGTRGDFTELGVTGLQVYSGYVNEEFLKELRGLRGVRIFQEMAENDPIVGAILLAIDLILRATEWNMKAADDSEQAKMEAEFALSLFNDMSHPFEDFISEALSMLVYGWSYHEVVMKRRVGPYEADSKRRSKYTDGRIGIRKLPIRSQDTLLRWDMQDDGGINGMWQMPPLGGGQILIPIEKALLFRTRSRKNSPEGVSILRNAYRPWYFAKNIEEVEAIGIERELAGLPVVRIPAAIINSTNETDRAALAAYKQMARDVKYNEQGGMVIPSDVYTDREGNPTNVPLVDVKLLTTGGPRAIDTNTIVKRHQQNIARCALADFIMLGTDSKGSYALSSDKTSMFTRACEAMLAQITGPINRFLLPRIWDANGLPRETMPQLEHGQLAPVDLDKIGNFIRNMAAAGNPLFPDENLDAHVRSVAGLPSANAASEEL